MLTQLASSTNFEILVRQVEWKMFQTLLRPQSSLQQLGTTPKPNRKKF